MHEHFIEINNWLVSELEHTTLRAISFYAHGTKKARPWISFAIKKLQPTIKGFSQEPVRLAIPGISFTYIGAGILPEPKQYGDLMIWRTQEPRIEIDDSALANLSPSYRTEMDRLNKAVKDELRDAYKLEGLGGVLTFPRQYYAISTTSRAVLIS